MGATETLVRFVVETRYNDLPSEAVEMAKGYIFDCVGHTIGGADQKVTQRLMKYVREGGGAPEAGVVGGGFKTTVPNAAWVNATSAHALELEETGRFSGSIYSSLIPAALALGEMLNAPGKSVIEAFVLGVEIQGRVGLGTIGVSDRGWLGFMYCSIGTAVLASTMLNFNVDQVAMALGHAVPYCGSFRRSTGYMSHLLDSGSNSRNGVTAAFLAKAGITSCPDIIEDWEGFGEVYCGKGAYDLEVMTKDLGNPFYIISPGTGSKMYGCCMENHRALDALFQVIQEHDVYYDQVESVDVETPPHASRLLRYHDPQNGEQAKFSLKHSLGAALLDRKPDLPWLRPFTDEAAVDPKYREARDKINWTIRRDLPMTRVHVGEQRVTVKMKDGRILTKGVDAAMRKGSRGMDLSKAERTIKFRNCVKGKISDEQVDRISELVFNLETLDDVREIAELMTHAKV